MGTSCACNYATIYYSYHKETNLLVNNAHLLLFYHRYINNAFIIQGASPNGSANFMSAMNSFGQPGARLEWETTPPGPEVDFLDLHIRLDPTGLSSSSSFQKLMNLYLYCPPASFTASFMAHSTPTTGTIPSAICSSNLPGNSSKGYNSKDTP